MKVLTESSQALAADKEAAGAWPPGFRFHPTDEELVLYYLKRKICRRRIKLDVIRETDVYKWDPEELPGQAILKTGDRQWFFFTPRDRKYPNGARSSRATRNGYWKATGKDRNITCNSRAVGVKKTLVYYRGRAPVGGRTDWVMHEYTLDEQELSRCKNVQDYYALYKVYKKSGPGPKNGEQYGAPFQEEEWDEDDYVDVFQYLDQGVFAKQLNAVSSLENSGVTSDVQSSLDALEKFMTELADEPELGENQGGDHLTLPKVVEEAQSTLVELSSREVVSPELVNVFHPSVNQCNVPASFDVTQSATSQLHLGEASEATSVADNLKHKAHTSQEDFLEIDDLIAAELDTSNHVENLSFGEMDGFTEYDIQDAAMFFNNFGPTDQGVSHLYVNTLGNDNQLNDQPYMQNQLSYSDSLQPGDMTNHLNYQLQPNMVNQSNYHFQPYSNVSDGIGSQLWMHDETGYQEAPSLPTEGAANECADLTMKASSGEESAGTRNGYSSALWSFVDSIPTTPASAAESPLVNRALEHMSSFSRVRITAYTVNADSNRAVARMVGRNKGFIFFSVLGAVCAILWWVLIGPVSLWGRCSFA